MACKPILPLMLAALLTSGPAWADVVRIASWGGVVSDANRIAYWAPYEKETGTKIVEDTFNGEIAKARAQVEAGMYQWDIAEMEDAEAVTGCEEGLYEKLDLSRLPIADLLPNTYNDCGIVSLTSGTGLAYNKAKLPNGPQTWADFFDTGKFPGKRGLRKSATITLEIALLGAGVPKEDVYTTLATKEGQDKAFAMLDSIKDHIVWWSSGTELIQGFLSEEFDIAVAYNGRIGAANKTQGQELEFVWNADYLIGNNQWVILKDSPNAAAAMNFIAWATAPEHQAEFMRHIDYASANSKAFTLLEPQYLTYMPNTAERVKFGIPPNVAVWRDNLDSLTERFNSWASE
ncbi:ABC transporter substrate-binding protein [Shinella sp. NM-101]|uniref:ABC transporter substrate-binding protein n=1 Tax=Shinella sp. NM-101 TaxID=2744455 RepID=UPI001F2D694E|nr:ABC transporter substrate-binding protein [Shinella sp. NM-101]